MSSPTPQPSRAAEVVVLATWSWQPLLHARDLRPGHHLTTLGADEPGKAELSAGLLTASRLVVDDRDLAAAGGQPTKHRSAHCLRRSYVGRGK